MLEDYRPDLGDGNEYMEQLQRRLETVEAVKQLYETEQRRTRSQMAVAFASGGVTGAIVAVCCLAGCWNTPTYWFPPLLSPLWLYAPLWQQHKFTALSRKTIQCEYGHVPMCK